MSWLEGSAEAGAGDGGLRWSFEFDLAGVLAAIGRPLAGVCDTGQAELLAAELAAGDDDGSAGVDLAGVVAECMPAGPGLAAWLSAQLPGGAADRDLAGLAAAFRKVASWAQAGELAMVAQVAARSAARDEKIGLAEGGRPAWVSRDAAAQVALGLALSPYGGEAWAQLAVTLQWRLPATGAALGAGEIDLYRARVIAGATAGLPEDAALQVEGSVLPGAGEMTYGQLHAAVRRAVIAADPEGAERRREASERQAAVRLYPDDEHTATLAAFRLPAVLAAAAMARLSALARGMQAGGAGGGIDLLRSQAFLGTLLGTLPAAGPSPGAPPGDGPPPEGAPGYDPPGDPWPPPEPGSEPGPGCGPGGQGSSDPGSSPPRGGPPGGQPRGPGSGNPGGSGPPDGSPRRRGSPRGSGDPSRRPSGRTRPRGSGSSRSADSKSGRARPDPSQGSLTRGDPRGGRPGGAGHPGSDVAPLSPSRDGDPDPPTVDPADSRAADHLPAGGHAPDGAAPDPGAGPMPGSSGSPEDGGPADGPGAGPADVPCVDPWPEVPPLSDADAPEDDEFAEPPLPEDCLAGTSPFRGDPLEDHHAQGGVVPPWPRLPVTVPAPPSGPASRAGAGRPPPGLLDLALPWATLTCQSASPGSLARIGPLTASQARRLARAAALDPAAQWRIILTDENQRAIAVARLPTVSVPDDLAQPGRTGLVGRVTVTMPATEAPDRPPPGHPGGDRILTAILRAATRARTRAGQAAAADQHAPGGCAHTAASAAYQPPPRTREHVTARDRTCRYPFCGQPAWRGDLDHTTPWHRGGRTCSCNLGALCRAHHILKQLPGWNLTQPTPGVFTWTTPAGRTYTTTPDTHPA